MARNKIELKLMRGNVAKSNQTPPDLDNYNKLVKLGREAEETKEPALIISLVDYPVVLKYGEFELRVSPRSRLKIGDHNKLDKNSLPKSIALKKLPSKASKSVKDKSEVKIKSRKKAVKNED